MGTTQLKNNFHLNHDQQFVVIDSTETMGAVGEREIMGAVGERGPASPHGVTCLVDITFDDRKRQRKAFQKWFRQTAVGAMMDKIKEERICILK